jgi:hypothetical protein
MELNVQRLKPISDELICGRAEARPSSENRDLVHGATNLGSTKGL